MDHTQAESAWAAIPARAERRVTGWLRHGGSIGAHSYVPDLVDAARTNSESVDFTHKLLQLVAGTDDSLLGALGLRKLVHQLPENMQSKDRLALLAGSITALGMPWAVLPLAKRWLRERVAGLVCAARLPSDSIRAIDKNLLAVLASLQTQRTPAQLVLSGHPVLGPEAAHNELRRLLALAYIPEVEYVIVDVGRVAPGDVWASEARHKRAVTALRQLIVEGAEHGTFVSLAASNYSDSLLAAQVANSLLADPEVLPFSFGVTLYAEVPESSELLTALCVHQTARKQVGGADLEIRIGVRTTSGAEVIHSLLTGLQPAVLDTRTEIEAAALRLAMQTSQASGMRTVFASDSAYLLAAALELFDSSHLTCEIRSGLAPELCAALAAEEVQVRVQLPVVSRAEFSAVVPYLLQLTVEAADENSALARGRLLDNSCLSAAALRAAELNHLTAVCELAAEPAALPKRTQNRANEWDLSNRDSALFYKPGLEQQGNTGGLTAAVLGLRADPDTGAINVEEALAPRQVPVVSDSGFSAEPGTDVSRLANRDWLRTQLQTQVADIAANTPDAATMLSAQDTAAQSQNTAVHPLEAAIQEFIQNFPSAETDGTTTNPLALRARTLRRVALAVVASRDRFTQLFAAHTQLSAKQIDTQVNHLIDAARYLAQQAKQLERVRGATFSPAGQALICCDRPELLADALQCTLAEFAAGNPVIFAGDNHSVAFVRHAVAEWQLAGVKPDALQPIALADITQITGLHNLVHASVFGSLQLRNEVLRVFPGVPLTSRNPQIGVAIVTAAADFDTAAQQLAESAFCGAANELRQIRAVILVGSAWRSGHLKNQLADAVRSVAGSRASTTDALQSALMPLTTAPTEQQLELLTQTAPGETWLVTPRQLDASGRYWSAGIKAGIAADSTFWQHASDLPILALLHASSLHEAIKLANRIGSGAISALYSWDAREIVPWANGVSAACLSVNRATSNARTEAHPGGTWNSLLTSIAPLAGGPHQLLTLGAWQQRTGTPSSTLHLRGLDPEIASLIALTQEWLSYEEFDRLRRAALADALTWRTQLGVARDVTRLGVEFNVLRYWPVATQLRIAEDTSLEQVARVLSAALLVRAPLTVSTGMALPDSIFELLQKHSVPVVLETDAAWMRQLHGALPTVDGNPVERIRLIGADGSGLAPWLATSPQVAVWAQPVTLAGPIELLSFLREQALSISNHRNGMVAKPPELAAWLQQLGK